LAKERKIRNISVAIVHSQRAAGIASVQCIGKCRGSSECHKIEVELITTAEPGDGVVRSGNRRTHIHDIFASAQVDVVTSTGDDTIISVTDADGVNAAVGVMAGNDGVVAVADGDAVDAKDTAVEATSDGVVTVAGADLVGAKAVAAGSDSVVAIGGCDSASAIRVRFKVMRLCCRYEKRGRLGIWRRRN
jgi:hypothetical protein